MERRATVNPNACVVYVDIDPMVEAYATALLAGEGVVNARAITADLCDPDGVLGHPDLRELIDFDEPVGLLLVAVAHFVVDEANAWGLVAHYIDVAPGSYLALSHMTADGKPDGPVQAIYDVYKDATERIVLRSKADVRRFFAGLDLVPPYPGAEPDVTFVGEWVCGGSALRRSQLSTGS